MKVVVDKPPNWRQIAEAFPQSPHRGVLFAWEDTIYNPSGVRIPPALIAHETVHGVMQFKMGGPEAWWAKYIEDHEFRYHEELLGHAAELQTLAQGVTDRNRIAQLFHRTAQRLTAPLYNYQPPRTIRGAVLDLRRELRA